MTCDEEMCPRCLATALAANVIAAFVVDRYVRDGQDSTVREIVAGTGLPEAKVRDVLRATRDDATLIRYTVTRDRNYPMNTLGSRRVNVYGPSRATLAARVRALTAPAVTTTTDSTEVAR